MPVRTVDAPYEGRPDVVATYLLRVGDAVAIVETATRHAVPGLLAALAEEGLRPEQVRYVIVTHAHLDHAGGAGLLMQHLPEALLLTHPKAAPHLIDPTRIVAGATAVYGAERFAAMYGAIVPVPAARVRAMADEETLTLGDHVLRFLHTRGHANHHVCVLDEAERGVFTGDSFGILYPYLQRNGPLVFPTTSPTDFDAAAAHATVDRIVATGAERVWPTHQGEHRGLPALAASLHRQLDRLGAVVDRADAAGLDGDALDAFCAREAEAHLADELAAHGLADDPEARAMVTLDADLNGQGLAFAVRKRRFKRAGGAPDGT